MKKLLIVLAAILLVASSDVFAGKKLGKKITVKETTQVSKILENPKDFEGKTVKVEGTIVGVCKHRGCWIELASDKKHEKIKVKVKDGEIVFPADSKGKKVIVQGDVEKIYIPVKEESKQLKKNYGDHECVKDEGKVIWRIKGKGAEIID